MIYDILPVNNYQGNGISTIFDFDFYIDNLSQLKVYLFDKDGTKYLLQNGIDYVVEGEQNPTGGYITFPLEDSMYGVLTDEQKISLELDLPVSQETQYNNSSLLNLNTLEHSFDYVTRLIQILKRKLSLCVKVEECSKNTPEELLNSINNANVTTNNNAQEAQKQSQLAKDAAVDAIAAQNAIQEIYSDTKAFRDEFISCGMYKFNLFDTKISDHILEGNEAKGWALQGTWVSGALYPDFYQRCLDEKNAATRTTITQGSYSFTGYKHTNGHIFFGYSSTSTASYDTVNNIYNAYGIADYYGIDEANERIFLPRNKYFQQLTDNTSLVNQLIEAGLPNIKSGTIVNEATNPSTTSGPFKTWTADNGAAGSSGTMGNMMDFDASRCSSVYGKSNTVQPPSSLKLLYYCVGNTVVNDAEIDAGALVSQMENKANVFDVDGQWVKKDISLGTSVSIASGEAITYDLSTQLPNDNNCYEIFLTCHATTGSTSGNFISIRVGSSIITRNYNFICGATTRSSSSVITSGSCILPIGSDKEITVYNQGNAGTINYLRIGACRRIGLNS